jgi:hypothetical protein
MAEKITEEIHKLLKMSEISLWLDTYDDIFSDFDPRPYSERTVSDDFLYEVKKASRDKPSGQISINFLIPVSQRNLEQESIIRKRLREHFRKHYSTVKKEMANTRKTGVLSILCGIVMMLAATYINMAGLEKTITTFLSVLLEPAGWFSMWFGFDHIFYVVGSKKSDLVFYEKMSKCQVEFTPY